MDIVIEDGRILRTFQGFVWDGMFSQASADGPIIQHICACAPKNTLIVIPKSDGNIRRESSPHEWHDVDWPTRIQPYLEYAQHTHKRLIIGTLCQIGEETDCRYVYLPLDDHFFMYGVSTFFPKHQVPWEARSNELCWRGSCSGVGDLLSTRVRFVKTIYDYNPHTQVRLSTWWSEGKGIPAEYFADRIHHSEFLRHKIFFIVDGNCIASNHMYGFASGCVPFLVSNATCWFSPWIIPYVHYIPIHHDMSNLIEQIEWVAQHDADAKRIADNAYAFAETHFSADAQHRYLQDALEYTNNSSIDAFE